MSVVLVFNEGDKLAAMMATAAAAGCGCRMAVSLQVLVNDTQGLGGS